MKQQDKNHLYMRGFLKIKWAPIRDGYQIIEDLKIPLISQIKRMEILT